MCSSQAKLPVAMILIMLLCRTCKALDGHQNCSSLCGDHNVISPFRLKDSAEECGDHRYELSCERNQLVLHWQSGSYNVVSINYENYTIRVRDSNIVELDSSSLPRDSLTDYNFSKWDPYTSTIDAHDENGVLLWYGLNRDMIYVRCEQSVDSLEFVDTYRCFKSSNGSVSSSSSSSSSDLYAYVGSGYVGDVGLEDDCRIEAMYMTSWPAWNNQSRSCADINHMLVYGFELSWLNSFCPESGDDYVIILGGRKPRCEIASNNIFKKILWVIQDVGGYVHTILVYHTLGKIVLGTPFVVALLIYKWRRRHLSMYHNIEDFLQSDNNIMPIRYSYKDIKKMTKGFKIKLGKGGYGSVFRGQLRSGRDVAVKILDKAKADNQEFINEVATLGRIHHINVVQLIGYCVEGAKRALIYEFMQNGSLDRYVFSKRDNEQSLDLHQLYAISIGVAHGIEYLHKGCNMQILHFDIKPHNILLDDNFIPKVSDFGLAKLYPTNDSIVPLTAIRGTIGYMAPELFYRNVGGVSYKADVYSFGKLLMDIAGRKKNLNMPIEQSSQFYFPFWVYDQLNEGNEIHIENATEEEMELARKMMIVGLWCIQTKPSDRPSMNKVVEMLEGEENDLEMPQKPYLYPQDISTVDVSNHSSSIMSSSDLSLGNCKETTSFSTQEDVRSI
ncbi:rust resistance kinase Lr10-like isoform X2 [Prosopis cineraria]|uniref:rust resistance kinase Lr10-like isoform X2 n=1 Tax=Prosopis cineraria TaxID=364024 RepID=UPI00240FFFC9|nr:rust resistance kinase Lr10-like isoform X2 [Prosopis cineraria]